MALIVCPDCQKQISDIAPACIHCGRPNQPTVTQKKPLTETASRAWSMMRGLGGAGKEKIDSLLPNLSSIAGRVTGAARESLDSGLPKQIISSAGSAVTDSWEWLSEKGRSAGSTLVSKIFRQCSVPGFLIPTGSHTNDFKCEFVFDQMLSDMSHGLFVQPELEVWAGRKDVDLGHLSAIIRTEFTRKLNEQRQRKRNAISGGIKGYELRQLEKQSEEAGKGASEAAKTVISAVLFLLFFHNPIVDLLFLSIAVFGTSSGAVDLARKIYISTSKKKAELDIASEQKRLEAELDSKNASFDKAIRNLKVIVHPVLQELLVAFCDVDLIPYIPTDSAAKSEAPYIGQFLRNSEYRNRVPKHLHALVDFYSKH